MRKLVVRGDAAATATNILHSESLYRLAVVADLGALLIPSVPARTHETCGRGYATTPWLRQAGTRAERRQRRQPVGRRAGGRWKDVMSQRAKLVPTRVATLKYAPPHGH